jgi:hypothetical protein
VFLGTSFLEKELNMPTGYTSDLYDGKSVDLDQFVMKCARAFGALVEMRDEPSDATIPDEFEPHDYHSRRIDEVKAQLLELCSLSEVKLTEVVDQEYAHAMVAHREDTATRKARRQRYTDMLKQVRKWVPPTTEHMNLKQFMIEQLEESIRFDCGYKLQPPKHLSPAKVRAAKITRMVDDIVYHANENASEIQRAQGRTEWVKALRDSLQA